MQNSAASHEGPLNLIRQSRDALADPKLQKALGLMDSHFVTRP